MSPSARFQAGLSVPSSIDRARRSPGEMSAQWRSFVLNCVSGYPSSWYEFENERRVRTAIQRVMDWSALDAASPEFGEWQVEIRHIDDEYKAILENEDSTSDDSSDWWMVKYPMYAGAELAEDLHSMLGIEIVVRDDLGGED